MIIVKNEAGIAHLVVLAVVVVALVSGTGYYVYSAQHKSAAVKNSGTAISPTSTLAAPLPGDLLPIDKVKALATTQKPSATIVGVQLENEEGVLVYQVKLADGSVLVFNAQTGAVVTNPKATVLEGDATLPATQSAGIDFAKARSIALAQHSGTVQKIELELEDGVLAYNIRFTDGTRIDINAADGTVLRMKQAPTATDSPSGKSNDEHTKSMNSSFEGNSGSHESTSSTPKASDSHDSTTTSTADSTSTETHNAGTVEDSSSGGSTSGTSGSGSGH